jgi:RHS repeat-associated protein
MVSALRRLVMGSALLFCFGGTIGENVTYASAAPVASSPIYDCSGGGGSSDCGNYTCPPGSMSQMRACWETWYNGALSQYFGPATFAYITYQGSEPGGDAILRWHTPGNGDYTEEIEDEAGGVDDPPVERNLGFKGCAPCGGTMLGNPINISTGNKFEDEVDYGVPGTFALSFHRYYNSASFGGDTTVGLKWTHTFSRSLTFVSSVEVKLFRDDGEVRFFYECGMLWCATSDETGTLNETTDSSGNVLGWQYTDENAVNEIYDGGGRFVSETNSSGISHILAYDGNGRLSTITDSFNRKLTLTYNNANQIAQLQAPDGGLNVYAYDTSGNFSSVTYPDKNVRTYFYNETADVQTGGGPNLLTGIQDEAGQRFATYQYDSQSRGTTSEHAAGANIIQVTYNADGSSTVLDASGNSRKYGFQTVQNVNHMDTVNGPACANCGINASYTYNSAGDLTSTVDFNGNTTNHSINASHLEETRVDGYGTAVQRTAQTSWNNALRVPLTHTVSDVNNTAVSGTSWVYNSRGQPLAKCEIDPTVAYTCANTGTVPAGVRRWIYTYCTTVNSTQCPIVGLLLTSTGPRTDLTQTTTYSYYTTSSATNCGTPGAACYQAGDLKTVKDALGHVTTIASYDGAGRITRTTDANGVKTDSTYSPRGWLLTHIVGGATTTLTYTAYGAVQTVKDPDGYVTTYGYDTAHRLTDITDAVGNNLHYTLDAAGNKTAEQIFNSSKVAVRSLARSFNTLGQLTAITDGLNKTIFNASYSDSYDANGNPVHTADALGTQQKSGYDALNRLVSTIQNYNGADTATQNATTTATLDALDRTTNVQDPGSLHTAYTFDGLSNRTALTSPDTGTSTDTFDAAGNRLVHTDAKGIVSTSTYDALNRPTGTTYADSTANVSYTYDEANAVTGCASSSPIGRRTRIVENTVTTVFCYDARGNVLQKTQTASGFKDVTQYAFTAGDRLKTMTAPDGTLTTYAHDTDGRVSSLTVKTSGASSAASVATAITWLPFGPVGSYKLGNGQTVKRTYDANYRVTDIASPGFTLHLAHDLMGNVSAIGAAAGANPATETYQYDPLYRLASVTEASGTVLESYTYDQTGDRLSKTASGLATGAYLYTTGTHQLKSIGNAPQASDANGNITGSVIGAGTYGFAYNGRNRLSLAQLNGSTVGTYTYNALGQRIGKVTTAAERYGYNENGQLLAEYGATNRDYLWMDDVPVAVVDNTINGSVTTSIVNYVIADQLNTPRAVTNSSGAVIWQWAYQGNPFGEQQPTSAAGYVLNLRFPGQYYDAETGTNYNLFRTFDPPSGRYLQADPAGQAAGPSLYAYVGNNPLSYTDPLGLCDQDRCKQLSDKINQLRNELAKRYGDLQANKLSLPLNGPMSIGGHQQQFENKQTQLRKLLNDFDSQGCNGGLPPDVWAFATKDVPGASEPEEQHSAKNVPAPNITPADWLLLLAVGAFGALANPAQ